MYVSYRKVLREAANGGRDAERVKLKLEVKVEQVVCLVEQDFLTVFVLYLILFCLQVADYDKEGSMLRVRGKNVLENEHVKVVCLLVS